MDLVWRVGWANSPLAFPPREYCSWQNRFEDPRRAYRTLYAASDPLTCLRERLSPLRPNTRALADFDNIFGPAAYLIAGEVSWELREEHVLAPAEMHVSQGEMIDIEDIRVRQHLEQRHAALLQEAGIDHLDLGELRSASRRITQAISRSLYDEGAAGILFRSKLDNQPCVALFEDRAFLALAGTSEPLTKPLPALLRVCRDYDLVLRERITQ